MVDSNWKTLHRFHWEELSEAKDSGVYLKNSAGRFRAWKQDISKLNFSNQRTSKEDSLKSNKPVELPLSLAKT